MRIFRLWLRWLTVPISRKAIPQNNKYNVQHFLDSKNTQSKFPLICMKRMKTTIIFRKKGHGPNGNQHSNLATILRHVSSAICIVFVCFSTLLKYIAFYTCGALQYVIPSSPDNPLALHCLYFMNALATLLQQLWLKWIYNTYTSQLQVCAIPLVICIHINK